jgi:hypothetical protein
MGADLAVGWHFTQALAGVNGLPAGPGGRLRRSPALALWSALLPLLPPLLGAPGCGSPAAEEWEAETTFLCTQMEVKRLEGVTRVNDTADLIAVEATGNCQLELVDVDLTSDFGVKANGNSVVTIRGGRIHGNRQTLQVLGNGRIVVEGATIEGPSPIGRAGKGKIEGYP